MVACGKYGAEGGSVDNCEVARQVAQGFKTLEALRIQGISRGVHITPGSTNKPR